MPAGSPGKSLKFLGSLLSTCFLVLIAVFTFMKVFFIDSRTVNSGSMAPTLLHGDFILCWRFAYTGSDRQAGPGLQRQDIVVILPAGKTEALIKRVIGLPGDTIALTPGGVYINSRLLTEEYLQKPGTYTTAHSYQVPAGQLFVLGDNRPNSWDSDDFGVVPIDSVKGKAFLLYYPFQRFRRLP